MFVRVCVCWGGGGGECVCDCYAGMDAYVLQVNIASFSGPQKTPGNEAKVNIDR